MSKRSEHSALASTLFSALRMSLLLPPMASGWDSTGRTKRIRYERAPNLNIWRKSLRSYKMKLYARRGTLPPTTFADPSDRAWTSFRIPLREPSTFPAQPVDIASFLATSLAFMVNLEGITMYLNGYRLASLTKQKQQLKDLSLCPKLDPVSKPTGIMRVTGVYSLSKSFPFAEVLL